MSRHDTFCGVGQDGSWGQVSCNCDYIKDIREDERERIIEMLEIAIAENGKDSWLDAIELIKGEQK